MATWYRAKCSKQIFWKGKSFVPGDEINLIEADMQILWSAGVIGDMKKIEEENKPEAAVRKPPENEMRPYIRRAKG